MSLLILEIRFELVICGKPNSRLCSISNDHSSNTSIQSLDAALCDGLLEQGEWCRLRLAGQTEEEELTFLSCVNCSCVLSDSKGYVMNASTPPAVAPAISDAMGCSFAVIVDVVVV